MILGLHAWFYRSFGYYTKYAKKKEQEYVKSLGEVSDFENGLMIGAWQMKHGFCRTSKQVFSNRAFRKRMKKRKK